MFDFTENTHFSCESRKDAASLSMNLSAHSTVVFWASWCHTFTSLDTVCSLNGFYSEMKNHQISLTGDLKNSPSLLKYYWWFKEFLHNFSKPYSCLPWLSELYTFWSDSKQLTLQRIEFGLCYLSKFTINVSCLKMIYLILGGHTSWLHGDIWWS